MKTKDTSLLLTGMRSPYFSPSQNVWIYSRSSQAHRVIYIKKGRNISLFCNIHTQNQSMYPTHIFTHFQWEFFLACLVNCNKQTFNCKLKQTISEISFWHFFYQQNTRYASFKAIVPNHIHKVTSLNPAHLRCIHHSIVKDSF